MSDSRQKNSGLKNSDQKKSSKIRFAAPFIPGGIVAALLIASLVGYEIPVYSANIEELALASTTDTDDTSAAASAVTSTVTLPELTEQPDESTISSGDTIESISAADESDAKYKDGTYTGTGTGWGGTITVQVVIKNGLIASVTILSAPDETPEYFTKAKSITSAIVKAQSTNVDTVSGATYSSNGIIEAVRDALAKARGKSSSSKSSSSGSSKKSSSSSKNSSTGKGTAEKLAAVDESSALYADGTYTGSGTGWGGTITVRVTIEGGLITDITIVDASDETEEYFNKATAVIDSILSGQTTNVDTVSGATYSSNGIIEAVRDALSKAAAAAGNTTAGDETDTAASDTADETAGTESTDTGSGSDSDTSGDSSGSSASSGSDADTDETVHKYLDGTYTGTGEGWGGDITVAVTISDDTITAIEILEAEDETAVFLQKATAVIDYILAAQSTDVDTVSGATYSSSGIIEAVSNALAEAEALAEAYYGSTDESSADDADDADCSDSSGSGDNTNSDNNTDSGDSSGSDNDAETGDSSDSDDSTDDGDNSASGSDDDGDNSASGSDDDTDDGDNSASGSDDDTDDGDNSASGSDDDTDAGDNSASGSNDDNDSDDSDGSEENDDSDDIDGTTSGNSETDPDDSDVSPDDDADDGTDDGANDSTDDGTDDGADDSTDDDADDNADDGTDDDADDGTDDDADDGTDDDADDDAEDGYTMLNGTYSIETTVYCDEWEDFYDYQISMLVTIESDAITAIDDITGDTDTVNQAYLKLAANGNKKYTGVVAQIVAAGNADDIDVVSGATCSSNAIIAGAKQAIEEATAAKASE